jgi:hypothetical protein
MGIGNRLSRYESTAHVGLGNYPIGEQIGPLLVQWSGKLYLIHSYSLDYTPTPKNIWNFQNILPFNKQKPIFSYTQTFRFENWFDFWWKTKSVTRRDLDPLQFFPLMFGHVVDFNHSFTYFLSLLKFYFIHCNLTIIELRKGEKTLEKKLERIQIPLEVPVVLKLKIFSKRKKNC